MATARSWRGRLRGLVPALAAASLLCAAPGLVGGAGAETGAQAEDREQLYLVTLRSGGEDVVGRTLDRVQAPEPVYRWRHALQGYAVQLDREQATELAADPAVVSVEPDSRRRLAGVRAGGNDLPGSRYRSQHGGRGTVIGLVDSGLSVGSPLFTDPGSLGALPRGFDGRCADRCRGKVASAHYFVRGFGADNLASSASLSPADDTGHGSQVASIAAGNPGVSISVRGQRHGQYAGVAPQARLAVYKACWTAPDPAQDGCSTADLVSAVDRAVAEGVDVLNLSLTGGGAYDTLSRALLGAAEEDVVVVAAAGRDRTVAHPEPWVTTVGATTGEQFRGRVQTPEGPTLTGAMLDGTGSPEGELVLGRDVAAPRARPTDAALCRPGSLDNAAVRGRIVLCDRGTIGRVDKSATVAQAGGSGMVLLNGAGRDDVVADLHEVPTVHLARADSRQLRRWVESHPQARGRLVAEGRSPGQRRVLPRSAYGDPQARVVKPDLLAPGSGLLGATPGRSGSDWGFLTGTSAASAQVTGLAAVLRSRHDFDAATVRSLLATSATQVSARALRRGSGEARRDIRPGLAFDVQKTAYRRFLAGQLGRNLNTASVMLGRDHGEVTRRITNVSGRTRTWTATASGFRGHLATVRPQVVTLRPGQSRQVRISVTGPDRTHPVTGGTLTWRAPGTTDVRVPVVLSR